MDVSIMIEGQAGMTWKRWQTLALLVEDLGFAGLFRSDHFVSPMSPGPDMDTLELWASLTWLASHTRRIHFGPLVSPVSLRHPVITAWTAAAVDDLSGGRLRLGLGAGWVEREHEEYGFELGSLKERFERFEEGVDVTTRLLKRSEPQTFEGRYFQLKNADLRPRPKRPGGPTIVIGGNGPKRTLPLAVRYADEWNGVGANPERFAALNAELDSLLRDAGREPKSLRRSAMMRTVSGRDQAEIDRKLGGVSVEGLSRRGALVGTPAYIAEFLALMRDAGAEEVMLQWLEVDDLDGIQALAKTVLPALQ